MAMVVKNNMAAVRTLNTLNSNSGALQKSLAKVSSGMRINSAQDDASGYAISERMRVQIRALDQANQNTQNGSSLMKTAEGAVASTVEILKTLKEKAINAATDTNTDADRQTIQKEVNQFIDQIDDNALVTFNGKYLIEGSKTQAGNATYTAFTNQNLATDTKGDNLLTDLKNRKGESLEITTSDKVSASFVKDGHTYATTFDVGTSALEDIFDKLNTEYTSNNPAGDVHPAFGSPNTDTDATGSITGDDVTQAVSALSDIANDLGTADLDAALTALYGGNDIEGGALTTTTIDTAKKDTIEALKQALAVASAYDKEGNRVTDFEKSALYESYTSGKTTFTGTVKSAIEGSAQIKIASIATDGTYSAGDAESLTDADATAAKIVTSMEGAMQQQLDDKNVKGVDGNVVSTIAGAAAAITVGGGADGETAISIDSANFAMKYLMQKAGEKFSTDSGLKSAFDEALKAAKAEDAAWKEIGGGDDTGLTEEQIQSAVGEAATTIASADDDGLLKIAQGDTEGISQDLINALAVYGAYTEAGAKATGGQAALDYTAQQEGIIANLDDNFNPDSSFSSKIVSVDSSTSAGTTTIAAVTGSADTATSWDDVKAGIADKLTIVADRFIAGDTIVAKDSSETPTTKTTLSDATKAVLTNSRAKDASDGLKDLAEGDVSGTTISLVTFNTAALVNAAAAKVIGSNLANPEEAAAELAGGGNEMVSGLQDNSTDPSTAETTVDKDKLILDNTSEIGLSASGKMVTTADGTNGLTVTANASGLRGQISGLTISIANSEGQVKKTTNEFLNSFNTTIFAANDSKDYSLKLHVGANANQSISVGLQDMRAEALGLKGSDGTVIDISTQERANAAIAAFDNAIQKALDQQTTIGAVEARLEYTASNLTTSAENTQAAESSIRDADMAKEMTNYTKNNVLLQAAQSMLAQANQNASAVLSLLQ